MPGLETYSTEDMQKVVDLLADKAGEEAFMTWVEDWVARNLAITAATQLLGYDQLLFRMATSVTAAETYASTTFGDLATVGPTLSELADGNWLVFWGCLIDVTGSDVTAAMGVQPNSAAVSDSHVASSFVSAGTGKGAVYVRHFGVEGAPSISGTGNNTITAKYARMSGTGTTTFRNRWMAAVRTGPAS